MFVFAHVSSRHTTRRKSSVFRNAAHRAQAVGDVGAELLGGEDRPVPVNAGFRVGPSAFRARQSVGPDTDQPFSAAAAASSRSVASEVATTRARSQSACGSQHFLRSRVRLGATLPRSRRSCFTRRVHDSETPNKAATSR